MFIHKKWIEAVWFYSLEWHVLIILKSYKTLVLPTMASGAQESENIRNGMQCLKLTHQIFHLFPNRYGIGTTP